jgi:transposase
MNDYQYSAVERAMKVQEVMIKAMDGQISWIAAAEILRISARQMRRKKRQYERQGYAGLIDRRIGQASPKRVPLEVIQTIFQLYRDVYRGFNVKHFHEKLTEEHGVVLGYTRVKMALQLAGLVSKHTKRGTHRRRRERRPLVGMMLHLDGSTHHWFGPEYPACDLLVLLDDANSEIYGARFVPQEDTRSVLGILREVVEKYGTFCSLYSDRASHFFYTPKAGEKVDRYRKTQVGRALEQLGIEMIPAYSPQARGRGERTFGTFQGRLPQELQLKGITTPEGGNRYLTEHFVPWFNRKLTVKAKEPGSAFVPVAGADLDRIFSVHWHRTVHHDNTVTVGRRVLQIPPSSFRFSFAKCRVTIYEHLDGQLTIGYGPHTLGRYRKDGTLLEGGSPVQGEGRIVEPRANREVVETPKGSKPGKREIFESRPDLALSTAHLPNRGRDRWLPKGPGLSPLG